jgi:hypothetical protein
MKLFAKDYSNILNNKIDFSSHTVQLVDHLGGFDKNNENLILNYLNDCNIKNKFKIMYITDDFNERYRNLDINFSVDLQNRLNLRHFKKYKNHPAVKIENFLCSFNGSDHVSRRLLTAILYKFGYFKKNYCSKNFVYSLDQLEGYIFGYCKDREQFYRKFFLSESFDTFNETIYSFGHIRYDHRNNIYNLENKLTKSFIHIVSETLATSYYPFVTEKFLYSIVTRGLFLSYAQPDWHRHIEKYYGFKLYTKLFDYRFDSIKNPVERLVELVTMISKFSKLNNDELYDMYLMELDTIEFNYDHYFSGRYLEQLKQHTNTFI